MGTNEFDPAVMPSARAARAEEKRMFISWPVYLLIGLGIAICILAAVYVGLHVR